MQQVRWTISSRSQEETQGEILIFLESLRPEMNVLWTQHKLIEMEKFQLNPRFLFVFWDAEAKFLMD